MSGMPAYFKAEHPRKKKVRNLLQKGDNLLDSFLVFLSLLCSSMKCFTKSEIP